jgi:hypothetical protein
MFEALSRAEGQSMCPSPAHVQAYAVHALPGDQVEQLDRHFADCPSCRLMAEDFARLDPPKLDDKLVEKLWQRLRPALSTEHPKPVMRKRWTTLAWALAPVAAAVLLVFALRSPISRPHGIVTTPRIEAPAALQYDLKQIAPVQPAPVAIPLDDLLTWRSGEADSGRRGLISAFAAYQKGAYVEAARKFAGVAASDPGNYQAAFYGGVALLVADRPREAVAALERAESLGGPAERDETQWYLGLALVHAGELTRGRELLDGLCAAKGAHAPDACQILRRLAPAAAAPPHN